MASAAITSSIFQEIQNFNQSRRTDLQQLATALQSGNFDAAKQAFSDLAAIGKNGPYTNAEPFSNSRRAQAFEAIGQALQSGDLAGARAAFATLQSTFAHRSSAATQQTTPAVIVNIGGGQNSPAATAGAESIFQQLQAFRQARQSDLARLGTALQSGDTAGAQQAYSALITLGQNGPNRNGATFQRTDRAQAFNTIGAALQNGNLAAAQQAFATLANSFEQNQPPVPVAAVPPPPVAPPTPTAPEIVINLGGANGQTGTNPEVVVNIAAANNSGSSGTPEEIQINLGSNGSGGKLTIDVNQNSAGEHVTIDFLQQSNEYRIALDLLKPTSHVQSGSLNLQA
jgi:Skp family chaperone for outer membrane proteins